MPIDVSGLLSLDAQEREVAVPVDPKDPAKGVVHVTLRELPYGKKRAVELRYLEHASTREIADALGVSDVNARQIVYSGLSRLRRYARRVWPLGRG